MEFLTFGLGKANKLGASRKSFQDGSSRALAYNKAFKGLKALDCRYSDIFQQILLGSRTLAWGRPPTSRLDHSDTFKSHRSLGDKESQGDAIQARLIHEPLQSLSSKPYHGTWVPINYNLRVILKSNVGFTRLALFSVPPTLCTPRYVSIYMPSWNHYDQIFIWSPIFWGMLAASFKLERERLPGSITRPGNCVGSVA